MFTQPLTQTIKHSCYHTISVSYQNVLKLAIIGPYKHVTYIKTCTHVWDCNGEVIKRPDPKTKQSQTITKSQILQFHACFNLGGIFDMKITQ